MTLRLSSHDRNLINSSEPIDVQLDELVPSNLYRSFFKRLFETVLCILAAPVVLLLVPVMAVLVALDGRNPFYSQLRVGRNGQVFRMWKLRTMVHGADDLLEAYLAANPAARAEWNQTQKLRNDPRITPIGRFLRKTSLDELPQLWNVVAGHMALVGPRPMMVSQRDSYTGRAYYNLRPGLTGLWQVSDRNNCEFSGRVHYDDLYERQLSLNTDLRVIFRTIGVVLRGTGC
ncbi:sugar transferase [uncultured Roseobacter sp.]|uniref:sugar transferase n=1 Tax=uncultured Roseobacter sp. TaxID=114847 RepID=UPI002607775C|nr:sugar transferase [uncultured Roseobacter sp.]